jgi:hypothetical protein
VLGEKVEGWKVQLKEITKVLDNAKTFASKNISKKGADVVAAPTLGVSS